MWINEFKDHSNQVSAQQTILTELIISKKWSIQANPGGKDVAQARDWTLYLPVITQLSQQLATTTIIPCEQFKKIDFGTMLSF